MGGHHGHDFSIGDVRRLADTMNISKGDARQLLHAMARDGTSLVAAAQNEGIDLGGMDPGEFRTLVSEAPESMRPQFLQDSQQLPAAVRDAVQDAFAPPAPDARSSTQGSQQPSNASDPAQAAPPANSTGASNSTSNNTGAPTVTNPAGNAPPGLNGQGRGDAPPMADPSGRFVVPGQGHGHGSEQVQNNNLIQRLFGAEAARADASQNLNPAMARNAASADAVQNPNATVHARGDGNGNAPAFAGVQGQGREASAAQQQALVQGRGDGGSGLLASAQTANAFAAQQASPQASAFTGQQAAAQAQLADRALADSPLPQNIRGGESVVTGFRAPDAAPPPPGLDRTLANQQQLLAQQQQLASQAQGRTDLAGATVMASLAGATVLANPQAHTMAAQLNPHAMPAPPGTENAASAARDALLAPAGHTLAGFLRRDHRGGQRNAERRPADWLLMLVPGMRKRGADATPDPMSFQWLFWITTIVAYGSLAAAVVIMIPNHGQLFTSGGTPTIGAYALAAGAVAALTSWWLGRRLAQ